MEWNLMTEEREEKKLVCLLQAVTVWWEWSSRPSLCATFQFPPLFSPSLFFSSNHCQFFFSLCSTPLQFGFLIARMERRQEETTKKDTYTKEKPKKATPLEVGCGDLEGADHGGGGGQEETRRLSSPLCFVGGVCSSSVMRSGGGGRGGGGTGVQPHCQADQCTVDLTDAKRYHRRHKVCEAHSKAPAVIVAGLRQRFCQQCSRLCHCSDSCFLNPWDLQSFFSTE